MMSIVWLILLSTMTEIGNATSVRSILHMLALHSTSTL